MQDIIHLGYVYGADGEIGHQEQEVRQAQADQQLVEHREHNLTQVTSSTQIFILHIQLGRASFKPHQNCAQSGVT